MSAPALGQGAPPELLVVTVGAQPGMAETLLAGVAARPEARDDVRLRLFVAPSPPPPPEAPPLRGIKAALKRAGAAFGEFELDEAKRRLAEAHGLLAPHVRSPAVLELEREALTLDVTLAHAARDDRRLEAAIEAYAQRFPGAQPPGRTAWPPAVLARLAKKTPPREASITIKTTPPGAALALDGEDVGVSPATVTQLVAGAHRLRAEVPGRIPADTTVEIDAGASAVVEVALPLDLSAALASAPVAAALTAEVAEAVRAAAGAPEASLVLVGAAGAGATLVRQDGPAIVARATVARRQPAELAVALDGLLGPRAAPTPAVVASAGPPTWAWLALGAGVASVGAGIGVRVSAVSVEHELISREGALTQTEAFSIQADAEARAAVGTALLVLGAAVASGVGAWLWYTADGS